MAGSSPSLPDGSNPSAAIVQSASDVQCSRLLKTTPPCLWMSELIGMVLSAVNVITAKLLRLPFRKALAEHPFGEQRTQVPAARFLHRPL